MLCERACVCVLVCVPVCVPLENLDLGVFLCLPTAIDGGSPDTPSYQQSAKGREGHMGGCQGKTLSTFMEVESPHLPIKATLHRLCTLK